MEALSTCSHIHNYAETSVFTKAQPPPPPPLAWRRHLRHKLTTMGSERKGLINNRLNNQTNNFARALHFLIHFFTVIPTEHVNSPMGRFMEGVNTRRRIFLSLSKLGCGLQELKSSKFHLHLTFRRVGKIVTTFEKLRIHFIVTFMLSP